jgi:putative ABC transport system permease protein
MRIFRRLWSLVRHGRLDDDLREELDTHLSLTEDDERAGGPNGNGAQRAARNLLGHPRARRGRSLDGVRAQSVEHLAGDLHHAVRMLRKNPSFTLTAVLSLALGIGVNAAMFSVINAVLVRPLPYAQPSRIVVLGQKSQSNLFALTVPEFDVVRQQNAVFASIAGYGHARENGMEWPGGQDWIQTMPVSASFLQTLGTTPLIGRGFDESDESSAGPPSVILANAVWQRDFGADPGVLGRAVRLDGTPSTVIGVMPAAFWLPQQVDALVPLRRTSGRDDLGANTSVIARLNDHASLGAAEAFLSSLTELLRKADRDPEMQGLTVQPLHSMLVGDVRVHLLLLFGATGLLLLLACVNLAMLLITRFAAREREIAVRVALGSGQRRLFTQFLVENLVLAGLGGVAGIATAYALVSGLITWIPFNLPAATPICVDAGVLAFAVAVAVGTAAALTLVPLAVARRLNVQRALRSTNRTAGQGGVRGRTRNVLVIAEVALSTTLLVGAGLFMHSLYQLSLQRLGFDPDGLITFVTPLDRQQPSGVERVNVIRAITHQLERIPGVTEVGATNVLPLAGWRNMPTEHAGHPDHSIGGMEIRTVTPNYFQMLGIAVNEGRSFTSSETRGVAMINETLARRWWPRGGAIGDRVIVGLFGGRRFVDDVPREVVGIVADAKDRALTGGPSPTVFVPLEQPIEFGSAVAWIVRGEAPSARLATSLRSAVTEAVPGQRVLKVQRLGDIVSSTTATSRFDVALFGTLATVGLVLAAVGLYGLLSFVVAGRRQEIGTRVALGAEPAQVYWLFFRQGIALTGIGLAAGLAGSLLLTRWLTGLLYEVKTNDPATFLVVAFLFLMIGGAASSLPARRAAAADPAAVLRAD